MGVIFVPTGGGNCPGRFQGRGHFDEKSDYDVYVYCTGTIPEESREALLSRYCDVVEIGNHFWEYEDNCTLKSGIDIDILYRNLDDFLGGISSVVDGYEAHNGYTTCMWHFQLLQNKNGNRLICPSR
ncbi:MAG: hypothetical protein ACOCMX_03660 [Acetivibrio ethanolgignens]